jgi:radical SAM superfamily enzyme
MDKAADWLERIRPDLYIDRVFGDAPLKFIVNPSWGLRMETIVAEFDALLKLKGVVQGSRYM